MIWKIDELLTTNYWLNRSKYFWFRITEKWRFSFDHYNWENIYSWLVYEWVDEKIMREWLKEFDQYLWTKISNHRYLKKFIDDKYDNINKLNEFINIQNNSSYLID